MIEIRVQNVISQVHGGSPSAHTVLSGKLAYRPSGYYFSPKYKSGQWDGYIRLYNPPVGMLPFGKFWTGLLHRAHTHLAEANIEHRIIDERVPPAPQTPLPLSGAIKERGFQVEAVEQAVARTRGILRVATAGGKTAIAARLIARLNLPCIFVVHRINLLNQARKSFQEALGVPIGIIQAEKRQLERFNVATIQTLDGILWSAADSEVRRFVSDTCQLVIGDEAHHGAEASWRRVFGHFTSAYYRFGVSATPHRHEGVTESKDLHVEGLFGRVIFAKDRQELTAEGHLAKPHVFFI